MSTTPPPLLLLPLRKTKTRKKDGEKQQLMPLLEKE
jgi:hypothetical protein